tara:strand:- start:277 stop:696 length:420 start_codon:yes stop_codon:yes gene_type:complete
LACPRPLLASEVSSSTRHEARKLQGRSVDLFDTLLSLILGISFIGGAVIGFVVALLSRARSRVWVSLGGAFGTFFGMAGVLVGFAVLAAIFDIKSGGGHGGAQAGFLLLLLLGGPLGAIFGSLLVRKLTGRRKSPRGKE